MIDLEAIRARNKEWSEVFIGNFQCAECGAGELGCISPADIDALIAEVERNKPESMTWKEMLSRIDSALDGGDRS